MVHHASAPGAKSHRARLQVQQLSDAFGAFKARPGEYDHRGFAGTYHAGFEQLGESRTGSRAGRFDIKTHMRQGSQGSDDFRFSDCGYRPA
jgi:hypothetical protein